MDNINKAPGGTPVRHKLKKVKRPIKRPVSTPETLSVPPKTTEFAAPRPDQSIAPAMTSSAAAEEHQAPVPEKMDAFSLDAFLDGDNLPAIQQERQNGRRRFVHRLCRFRHRRRFPFVRHHVCQNILKRSDHRSKRFARRCHQLGSTAGTSPLRRGRKNTGLCFVYYESAASGLKRPRFLRFGRPVDRAPAVYDRNREHALFQY